MNPVSKLLRHNLSLTQTIGFALANFVGLTIVVAGLMVYLDARPIWNTEDSFMKKDYVVINKKCCWKIPLARPQPLPPTRSKTCNNSRG